jgi:hypothetical protein
MKAKDQYIVCHVMCDDIGEFRALVMMSLADIAQLVRPGELRLGLICVPISSQKLHLKQVSQKLREGTHRIPPVTVSGIYQKAHLDLPQPQMHLMATIWKLATFWP